MTQVRFNKAYATYSEEGNEIVIDLFGAPPSELAKVCNQVMGKSGGAGGLSEFTEKEIREYVKDNFDVWDWVSVECEPEYYWN